MRMWPSVRVWLRFSSSARARPTAAKVTGARRRLPGAFCGDGDGDGEGEVRNTLSVPAMARRGNGGARRGQGGKQGNGVCVCGKPRHGKDVVRAVWCGDGRRVRRRRLVSCVSTVVRWPGCVGMARLQGAWQIAIEAPADP